MEAEIKIPEQALEAEREIDSFLEPLEGVRIANTLISDF